MFFLFNQRTSTNITGGAHIVTDLHRYFVDTKPLQPRLPSTAPNALMLGESARRPKNSPAGAERQGSWPEKTLFLEKGFQSAIGFKSNGI